MSKVLTRPRTRVAAPNPHVGARPASAAPGAARPTALLPNSAARPTALLSTGAVRPAALLPTAVRPAASVPYAARLAAYMVLLMGLLGLLPVPAAHAAAAPVTQDDLCAAWNAAGTSSPQITLASGLTVKATAAQRLGASCTSPGAGVSLTGASVVEKSGPSSGGNAASQVLAAITQAVSTDPSLKQGDELFKGAYLTNFNATLKLGYFEISGAVELKFTGGTVSRFLFSGKLYGVDRFTMTLKSPVGGTTLPNIGGTPVDFTGTLELHGTTYTLALQGSAASIVMGDGDQQVSVKNATVSLSLTGDDTPHVHAVVTGTIGIGTAAAATGTINADFDEAGLTSFAGSGSLAVAFPAKGSNPAGSITGNANLAYTREPLARSVRFTGEVKYGDAIVANANGSLDDQSASFVGAVTYTTDKLTAKGSVDGLVYFGDNLAGRTITNRAGQSVAASKGDALLKAGSASLTTKGVTVTGGVQLGSVGTEVWATGGGSVDLSFTQPGKPDTTIKGSADITWVLGGDTNVAFSGSVKSGDTVAASASGTIDGKKLTFSADLTSPQVSGKAKGAVYYGTDLAGETVKARSGSSVPASRGDYVLDVTDGRVQLKQLSATAAFTLSKVGLDTWVKTSAQIKVAQTYLTFAGEIDSSGNFNLQGSGTANFDGYQVAFNGTAVSKDGKLVINGGGTIKTGLFTVALSGTIEKPDMATSGYVLTGTVNFKFGSYSVAGGTVRLTFGEGLTTSFSLKACFLFICQNGTYKLYFAPDGTVNRAELNAPLTSVPTFLGIGSAVLGSKVKISTKITGII